MIKGQRLRSKYADFFIQLIEPTEIHYRVKLSRPTISAVLFKLLIFLVAQCSEHDICYRKVCPSVAVVRLFHSRVTYTAQRIEIHFRHDRVMFLVSWGKFRNLEFRGSPQRVR